MLTVHKLHRQKRGHLCICFLDYIFFFRYILYIYVKSWIHTFIKHVFILPQYLQFFYSFLDLLFFLKSLAIFIKVLTYFHTENVILSFVIFRMISKSQKKEEVYNILIINNLYINIYFFCFQFLEKWQMTNDILPITTFNALILNNLRTQKCHFFSVILPRNVIFWL